jgi:hypothetical protein
MSSLDFAGLHFDEVATYTIELNPDLPAWRYKDEAYSKDQLQKILEESREYLKKYDVLYHSGQQDDSTMQAVEQNRKLLRESKKGTPLAT